MKKLVIILFALMVSVIVNAETLQEAERLHPDASMILGGLTPSDDLGEKAVVNVLERVAFVVEEKQSTAYIKFRDIKREQAIKIEHMQDIGKGCYTLFLENGWSLTIAPPIGAIVQSIDGHHYTYDINPLKSRFLK